VIGEVSGEPTVTNRATAQRDLRVNACRFRPVTEWMIVDRLLLGYGLKLSGIGAAMGQQHAKLRAVPGLAPLLL